MRETEFTKKVHEEFIKNFKKNKSKFHNGMLYKQGFDDGASSVMDAIQKVLGDNSLVIVDRATVADMEWLQEVEVDLGDHT